MTSEFAKLLDFAAEIAKGKKPKVVAVDGRIDNEMIQHFFDMTKQRYGIDCHFAFEYVGAEFIEAVIFRGMNVERGDKKYQSFTFTQNVCAI